MAPTIRSSSAGGASGSIVVAKPAGLTVGDYLLAWHTGDADSASLSAPSGWTALKTQAADAASNYPSATVWGKVATAADVAATSFTFVDTPPAGTTSDSSIVLLAIQTGTYDTTTPIAVSAFTVQPRTSTPAQTAPSTSAAAGDLLLACYAMDSNGVAQTYPTSGPTGMSYVNGTGGPGNYSECGVYSQAVTAAGATGTKTVTPTPSSTTNGWTTVAVVVKGPSGEQVSAADTAASADSVTVIDQVTASDAAAAADAVTTSDLEAVTAADVASGADTVAFVDVATEQRTAADTAAGADTVTVADVEVVTVGDTATGSDAAVLAELLAVADTAIGTDTADAPVGTLDIGVGDDTITVLDVPFIPRVIERPGPVYELLVAARVPAAVGEPTFLVVDPIVWSDLDWTREVNEPATLELSCQLSSLTEGVLQRLRRPHALATELWLLRDGKQVFAGPLAGGRRDGEQVKLTARGLLAYLRRMMVYSDLVFSQVDQHLIAKGLVDHWQARPFGHFGIDTSTVGESGQLRDATYLRQELHQVLQRVTELGGRINGFDVDVDPETRELQLWSPRRGVDRSTGDDAVVFDSRNITNASLMFSVAEQDVATVGFGTSTTAAGDARYAALENAELLAQYGASAISGTWDKVSEQATLDDHVQALLAARSEALFVPGPNVRVTPDADLQDYEEGDTVRYELDEQLGVTGAFRLQSLRVSVSATGVESVTPTFV